MARIESKVEFVGKFRGAWKLQAGTAIAQIVDHTRKCRMVSQHENSRLAYDRPLNTATLEHDLFSKPVIRRNSLYSG
jgi:hypothetical protein